MSWKLCRPEQAGSWFCPVCPVCFLSLFVLCVLQAFLWATAAYSSTVHNGLWFSRIHSSSCRILSNTKRSDRLGTQGITAQGPAPVASKALLKFKPSLRFLHLSLLSKGATNASLAHFLSPTFPFWAAIAARLFYFLLAISLVKLFQFFWLFSSTSSGPY